MSEPTVLSTQDRQDMERKNIDIPLSVEILDRYNRGEFDNVEPVVVNELPLVDGTSIIDFTTNPSLTISLSTARDRLAGLVPDSLLAQFGKGLGSLLRTDVSFARSDLESIGLVLLSRVSYGVLNGGSATSYADRKKNQSFSAPLMDLLHAEFSQLAEMSHGRPKGLTPAFLQPDGTPGPSFLQLKMRGLLCLAMRSRSARMKLCPSSAGSELDPLLPMFEMTSIKTDSELKEAYREYRTMAPLSDLIELTGLDPTLTVGAVQPLISAFTHSSAGRPKSIFNQAFGTNHETLPLPGGHGQNFAVLAETYRSLRSSGKRFAYLGNVDNLGFLPDPVAVAYLALTGKQAGFDFAFKTPVDVKGGILVRDQRGHLNCADIGPAISRKDVEAAERSGTPVLFSAATGLFDLDYLVPNLDRIANDLPTRFSDQSKDAGDYSQAEQVTWEVVGMLDDFLVFSVSKWERFLAAKLLTETLMTSGIALDHPDYPTSDEPASDLRRTAGRLHQGLASKLRNDYGMELKGERWEPLGAATLNKMCL